MRYEYINKLEQFNELDIDLIIFDKDIEIRRIHKCFKKKYDEKTLDLEAQKEIDLILNPLPEPEPIKTEVEILQEKIITLENKLIEKDSEIESLKIIKVIQ